MTTQDPETIDPNGPPQPVESPTPFSQMVNAIGVIFASGVAGFTMLESHCSRVQGATRSSRIEWERRDAEIDRAIAAAESRAPAADDHSTPSEEARQ